MVKRTRHTQKSRKTSKKPEIKTTRSKKARKTISLKTVESEAEAAEKNRKAQWTVYQELQKKADEAWGKLRSDVRRKAPAHILLKDRDNLLLLLGECNYMATECLRMNGSR